MTFAGGKRGARLRDGALGDAAVLLSELEPLRRAARELLSSTDALGATARLPYELRLR